MVVRKLIACKHSHSFVSVPSDPMGGIEYLMATGEDEEDASAELLKLVASYNWTSDPLGYVWQCGRHKES